LKAAKRNFKSWKLAKGQNILSNNECYNGIWREHFRKPETGMTGIYVTASVGSCHGMTLHGIIPNYNPIKMI